MTGTSSPLRHRVLVSGAGIGGLTVAAALARRGADVHLIEKADHLQSVGAGLILAANAVAVLKSIGVDVASRGERILATCIRDRHGKLLQRLDLGTIEPLVGRAYGVHRGDLHHLLREAASHVPVRTGLSVAELHPDSSGVDVVFTDGSRDRFDLVIGADGVHSEVRRLLLGPAAPETVYAGYTTFRFICPNPGVTEVAEYWGRGHRAGLVPLTEGRLYVFLVSDAPRRAPAPPWPDGFHAAFDGFGEPVKQAIDSAVAAGAKLLHHDLEDLERTDFGHGRVWLLGDAAHAMLPNLGQGAAMAIEDAAAIPLALAEVEDVPAAHARYLELRAKRAGDVWRRSRRLGWMAQWNNPVACWLRNGLTRMVPPSVAARTLQELVRPGLELAASSGPTDGAMAS